MITIDKKIMEWANISESQLLEDIASCCIKKRN